MPSYYEAFDKDDELNLTNILTKEYNDRGYTIIRDLPSESGIYTRFSIIGPRKTVVLMIDENIISLGVCASSNIYDGESFGRVLSAIEQCLLHECAKCPLHHVKHEAN